jgi:hypothetical protein
VALQGAFLGRGRGGDDDVTEAGTSNGVHRSDTQIPPGQMFVLSPSTLHPVRLCVRLGGHILFVVPTCCAP